MLALLQTVPTDDEGWARFSFANQDCVDQIQDAIRAQLGINLSPYQLEPIPWDDFQSWTQSNYQAHVDFTLALGQQSTDISKLDPTDAQQLEWWVWQSWMELNAACERLKIGP